MRTLLAMTGVQAVVGIGIFGLGVAAPLIGLPVEQLGWFNTIVFGLGAVGASWAGPLCLRWGGVRVSLACVLCVFLAAILLTLPATWLVWPAAIMLGLAFGPDTPASSASLVRVTTPEQRGSIIALRQTGNQWGAIAASLCLPALLLHGKPLAFGVLALLCALLVLVLWSLRDIDAPEPGSHASRAALLPTLREQWHTNGMRALLALSACYAAVQIGLNGFAFSYLVGVLGETPARAGLYLATAQAAGLVARLLLGAWARRTDSTARALGWIGAGIALSTTAFALLPAGTAAVLMFPLMGALGFLVSGWNGLLLAELSRLAGPTRTAAWTGACMTVSYVGLLMAPLLFATAGSNMRPVYLLLAAGCAVCGVAVLRTRTSPEASVAHHDRAVL
ncbi:MAG: MFS transporter [Moraxellaceae bacterium]|nr:MFS transporter [Moraxellaceae bacterium]